MGKDLRAKTVNRLISLGDITEFNQIFDHFAKTPLSREVGIRFERVEKLIKDVDEVRVGDIYAFCQYFEVPPEAFFKLITNQHIRKQTKAKK